MSIKEVWTHAGSPRNDSVPQESAPLLFGSLTRVTTAKHGAQIYNKSHSIWNFFEFWNFPVAPTRSGYSSTEFWNELEFGNVGF